VKAVLQRVAHASVTVDGRVTGRSGPGLLVLLGVGHDDDDDTARKLAEKTARLRIFGDEHGKMNTSVRDIGGTVLSVSQFTLYGDTRKGNRPSFVRAAPPDRAQALYHTYNAALRDLGVTVEEGVFGAHMRVELVNDGPVTIILEL